MRPIALRSRLKTGLKRNQVIPVVVFYATSLYNVKRLVWLCFGGVHCAIFYFVTL